MIDRSAHFRLARPISNLHRALAIYHAGLGVVQLGHFENHEDFDGVMLGIPGEGFHFEFTYCQTHPVTPMPTTEDLLVFYWPNRSEWQARCKAMLDAGFIEVSSFNPYWERDGCTFQDSDGYRVVIQCASWANISEA